MPRTLQETKHGTYVWDSVRREFVKVSNRTKARMEVSCPEGGYYSENLGAFVRSRQHKRELLEKRGLRETNDRYEGTVV